MIHVMKKVSFLWLFLMNTVIISIAQDYNLQLHIEGMQYDTLKLGGENMKGQGVFIEGKTIDNKNWNFVIPDSIYNSVAFFTLSSKPQDADLNTVYKVYFITHHKDDTLKSGGIFLDRTITKIDMKYLRSEVFNDMLFFRLGAERTEENLYTANLHIDQFVISYFDNTDFVFQFTNPYFGTFYSLEKENVTYEEYIDLYMKMIEKFPDSRFLITQIANYLQRYKRKEDLQKLYNAFSEINRQTSWGKIIYDYIENYYTFADTILQTWDTGNLEPIIQDSTKINLVVFSASWCVPCHEQIPLLKQIYNDLKECINITYISEDEPKYVDSWKKLMEKENISWRSLLAGNDVVAIKKKYNAVAIPYTLLVYPNKRFETIDVRIKEDKDKLYSLCGK